MTDEPGVVPEGAVRPISHEQVSRLDLPHAVAVRLDGAWRPAWLLGHDRDAGAFSFLVQRPDAGGGQEPVWVNDVELGEIDPRYGVATA